MDYSRHKLLVLSLLLGLLYSGFSYGKYRPYKIHELIKTCDIAVVGKITSVNNRTFELSIDSLLIDKINGKPTIITVNRQDIHAGVCPPKRWTEYSVGQQSLFFLKKVNNKKWSVLSLLNEGEFPIKNDSIYCLASSIDLCGHIVEPSLHLKDSLKTLGIYGYAFNKRQFIDAIIKYYAASFLPYEEKKAKYLITLNKGNPSINILFCRFD